MLPGVAVTSWIPGANVGATATQTGPSIPVLAPEMVATGATLPLDPRAYSVTELPVVLATNRFPKASTAIPPGESRPVLGPEIVAIGETSPVASGAYSVT